MRLKKAVEIAKQNSPEAQAGQSNSETLLNLLDEEPTKDIDSLRQEQISPPKSRMTAIEKQLYAARKEIEVSKEADADDFVQSEYGATEAAVEGKKSHSSLASRVLRRLSRLKI